MAAEGTHYSGGGRCTKQKIKGGTYMTIEISTAIIVSVLSLGFSVFMGLKNNKRTDVKDIEERVKNDTRINMKLDNIAESINAVKDEVLEMRGEISSHNDKIIKLEESVKQAHKRINELVERLNNEKEV